MREDIQFWTVFEFRNVLIRKSFHDKDDENFLKQVRIFFAKGKVFYDKFALVQHVHAITSQYSTYHIVNT